MEKRTHYFDQNPEASQEELFSKLDDERTDLGKQIVAKRNERLKHSEPEGKFEFKENYVYPWLLEKSQDYLNDLLNKFGVALKEVSIENIHFDQNKDSALFHNGNSRGYVTPDINMITVYLDVHNYVTTIKTLIHELLHYNSFQTFKIDEDEDIKFEFQRIGLSVKDRLNFFNEGLTEYWANKDLYEFIENDKTLKSESEKILKKSNMDSLNEYNVKMVTKPSYEEEVYLVGSIRTLLSYAYEVDGNEVDKWFAEAYFNGNILQLFKKIKKVTDTDLVNKLLQLNELSETNEDDVREVRTGINKYISKYDTNIHDTVPDNSYR